MAGKTDVEDGRADAVILDNVDHAGHQRPRLPGKGTARLEDDTQVGIALVETGNDAHQPVNVVVGTCHEVTAAKVDPLQLGEPATELLFDMAEGALKDV